jgi:hypothetical protein
MDILGTCIIMQFLERKAKKVHYNALFAMAKKWEV